MKGPGFGTGLIIGGLLTLMLASILYLGELLAGFPFVPFDLFDWTARRLPGELLTAGIDAMVAAIAATDLGPTADVAKAVEQGMAIGGFLLLGTLVGGFAFVAFRRLRGRLPVYWAGLALGAAAAAALLVTGIAAGTAPGALWLLALFLAWGAGLAWGHTKLTPVPAAAATTDARAEPIDRRTFLVRLGGATAVLTVAGAVVGSLSSRRTARDIALSRGERPWSATNPLPNAGARVQPVRGTRAELTPVARHYRIDINTRPPVIDGERWRLRVDGLVQAPRELSIQEIRALEPLHQFVTLQCISNRVAGDLISTTRWTGVSLQRLLPELRLRPEATHLRISSADGFHEVLAMETVRADPRVMLCYAWDGLPLPPEHGFPLRVYIPDRYGMKQPKWIESIEAIDDWEAGYWVRRGWDREARVKATAVIDTVATDMMMPEMRPGAAVPVGGIAYAGARGISRVEIRVDDGDWVRAELRDPLSGTSWVLWRFDWPFREGEHTLTVRCFDGSGAPQVAEPSPPHPDGATGLHRTGVML